MLRNLHMSIIDLIESAVFHKESDDQFDQIRKRILSMESERVKREKDIEHKIEVQRKDFDHLMFYFENYK